MTTNPTDPGANWCPECGEPRGVCQCNPPAIVTAAYALKGYESIVIILRTEAKRLSTLGFTATSAQVYMAARLLDLLFVEINKEK